MGGRGGGSTTAYGVGAGPEHGTHSKGRHIRHAVTCRGALIEGIRSWILVIHAVDRHIANRRQNCCRSPTQLPNTE